MLRLWLLRLPPAQWAGCSPQPAPASAFTPPLIHFLIGTGQVSLFCLKPVRRPCGLKVFVYCCPLTVSLIPCCTPTGQPGALHVRKFSFNLKWLPCKHSCGFSCRTPHPKYTSFAFLSGCIPDPLRLSLLHPSFLAHSR